MTKIDFSTLPDKSIKPDFSTLPDQKSSVGRFKEDVKKYFPFSVSNPFTAQNLPETVGVLAGNFAQTPMGRLGLAPILAGGGEAYKQIAQRTGLMQGEPPQTTEEAFRNILKAMGRGYLATGAGEIVGAGINTLGRGLENIGGQLGNQYLGTSAKSIAQSIKKEAPSLGEKFAETKGIGGSRETALNFARNKIDETENKIQDMLKVVSEEEAQSGYNTINVNAVASRLDSLAASYQKTGVNKAEVTAINKIKKEFLSSHPETINIETANDIKRKLYENIGDVNYLKDRNTVRIQAEKELASALRSAIEDVVPEIKPLNQSQGNFLQMRDALVGTLAKTTKDIGFTTPLTPAYESILSRMSGAANRVGNFLQEPNYIARPLSTLIGQLGLQGVSR